MASEKRVSYTSSNTYSTLNNVNSKTKNVWLVFHGMGYLSKYFIRYFNKLDSEENYIIAPQAPSKYYLDSKFKHVGASWLTREDTLAETKNVLHYLDEVWKVEKPMSKTRFIVLGYSQGVSIALRWLSSRNIPCDELILHSGSIPKELIAKDFSYLKASTKITYLYGNEDPYINKARKEEEALKGAILFGDRLQMEEFNGSHEVHTSYLYELSVKH